MHKQRGVSLSGFLMWSVVLIFGLLLGFRIGPAYYEYITIKRLLQDMGSDSESQTGQRRDVESAWMKRTMIEDVKSVTGKDLSITKDADGVVISVDYTTCSHVVANLRACMDFSASSRK
jgi:hypothetical protein